MKSEQQKLTPGELELLEILWEKGDLTLSAIHGVFQDRGRGIAYSTVQTRLDRMVKKGLLERTSDYGGGFRPLIERENVSGKYFDLIEELCSGTLVPLMLHMAKKRALRPDELATMRKLLDESDVTQGEKPPVHTEEGLR